MAAAQPHPGVPERCTTPFVNLLSSHAQHHLAPGHKHTTSTPSKHISTSAHHIHRRQHTSHHNGHTGISTLLTVSLHNDPSLNTSSGHLSPYPHPCAHQPTHQAQKQPFQPKKSSILYKIFEPRFHNMKYTHRKGEGQLWKGISCRHCRENIFRKRH